MFYNNLGFIKTRVQRAYFDNVTIINAIVNDIYKKDFKSNKEIQSSKVGESFIDVAIYPLKNNTKNKNFEYSAWVYTCLTLPQEYAVFVETVVYAEVLNSKNWTSSKFKKYMNKKYNNIPHSSTMVMPAIKKANQVIYDLVGADNSFDEIYVPDMFNSFKKQFNS